MNYAIIAAGLGSRLQEEGVSEPKPLVSIRGEKMIDRLVRIFCENEAESVSIIVNEESPLTLAHVRQMQQTSKVKINLVVKSTPSSMHSLYALSPLLKGKPFCLTTCDTIFREEEFAAYIRDFKQNGEDGIMAVTDYIDDEKPLYVATDNNLHITAFRDTNEGDKYISGGIYTLSPRALDTLQRCIEQGQSRMRNFQRALIADGLQLRACPFSKILDIDHASDILKAEEFLSQNR